MSSNALYTDLSGYYDLMCSDINYQQQSASIHRLHQFLGNNGKQHLDLACGTGPHVRHFIDLGYQCSGLDINQPMLDMAMRRCPEAQFNLQDMTAFYLEERVDLITCFLYSIHYSACIERLKSCIASVHSALNDGGLFCFNTVDKHRIDNTSSIKHFAEFEGNHFAFESGWHYSGQGEKQSLTLSIEKSNQPFSRFTDVEFNAEESPRQTELWQDQHAMVATSFAELQELLAPYFEVHIFEHDYEKIIPWDLNSGNALFVCVKI
ncbi:MULTISPECIES: class I SAM-dependent DNA methyltransferase [Shewanella]|uniref:Class I SAM-dependent methyltransferase n=1 Tax=Shewanella putrefaciens TaxID=24 RepID=A0ABX8XD60_SHEPU|nr:MULTISPECIES: class I SAM-dependent methyltransferase [Shewanella]ABM26379.1 Methyltransferase type 11 [Shewanella sp. W3-18-1]AVV83989.1 SAM-dependent methyltransferase [Shewanella putrefaciens]MCT8944677.1 class I SAM-dependent methyltransferase [Shewanella putrefaciens]QSE49879.1 class I SAM-dependent methyltransferase [Shewanella putrefaciens]QYX73288.1 class I SAM-dependent methyltransferase [Shewanella putrefaciens]